jgi:hypothetical protein
MITHALCAIYNPGGRFILACRVPEEAAAHIAQCEIGSTIRIADQIVWTEGSDGRAYDTGYSIVAETMLNRLTH